MIANSWLYCLTWSSDVTEAVARVCCLLVVVAVVIVVDDVVVVVVGVVVSGW